MCNKLIRYYKDNKAELYNKTAFLDNCFLYRDISQRVYHLKHNLTSVPRNKNGWYMEFINCEKGYSTYKSQNLHNIQTFKLLNESEKLSYFLTKKDISYKDIKDFLVSKTNFLTPYEPSLSLRAYYIRNNLKVPVLDIKNKLIDLSNKRKNALYFTAFQQWNELNSDAEKIDFIKNKWLHTSNRTRATATTVFSKLKVIDAFLLKKLDKNVYKECKTALQKVYHLVHNIRTLPVCPVCSKHINAFYDNLLCYPKTCSHACNNTFRDNIEKRLANNSTNIHNFQTNIGTNEKNILDSIEKRLKLKLLKSQRIGSYFPDGVDLQKKIIVEVNEIHHSHTRHLIKDTNKYKYFKENGFKIVVVLDGWPKKNTTQKQKTAINVYEEFADDIVFYKQVNSKQFELFSQTGFCEFQKIKKTGTSEQFIEILTTNKQKVVVTPDHNIFSYSRNKLIKACELQTEEILLTTQGLTSVKSIKLLDAVSPVYDIINTETGYFFANNILVHNCIDEAAFIDPHFMEEFWKSVIPIVSSGKKTKIFMVSTPNGTGNKFYEIYSGAEKEANGWKAERIDWWDVPGRGEKWRKQMVSALGSDEAFQQEFGNTFLDPGNSAVGASVIERFKEQKKPVLWSAEESAYKVFEVPDSDKMYVIGVDVGEGIGRAASVAQVLDITDLQEIKQVGVYGTNTVEPYHYANKLVALASQWGNPPLLIERNNCGGQVIDALFHKHYYEKIVSCSRLANTGSFSNTRHLGVLSHNNLRFAGVANMRYWVNFLQTVHINDIDTIKELETFIRYPNGTYRKKNDNFYDDRVMSLVWTLFVLEPEICQQYFQIEEFDDQNKPKKLSRLDYFDVDKSLFKLKELSNTGNITTFGETEDNYQPLVNNEQFEKIYDTADLDDLIEKGYKPL